MTEEYPFKEVLSALKTQTPKETDSSSMSKGSWVAVLVVIFLALISVGVLMFRSFRLSRKLSRALHERDVLVDRIKQAEVDEDVADREDRIASLEVAVQDLEIHALGLHDQHVALTAAIRNATTWDELDQIVR